MDKIFALNDDITLIRKALQRLIPSDEMKNNIHHNYSDCIIRVDGLYDVFHIDIVNKYVRMQKKLCTKRKEYDLVRDRINGLEEQFKNIKNLIKSIIERNEMILKCQKLEEEYGLPPYTP